MKFTLGIVFALAATNLVFGQCPRQSLPADGFSVALQGATVAVENLNDTLDVYSDHSGQWVLEDSIPGDDDAIGAVALSNETILLGNYDTISIYEKVNGVWVFHELFNEGSDSGYGSTISATQSHFIAGEDNESNETESQGKAFIYAFLNGHWSWSSRQVLTAPDGYDFDIFGRSVSISAEYAIVGAPRYNDAASYLGAAYFYHCDGTAWQFTMKVEAPLATVADYTLFGWSVAIDGDRAVVGAPGFATVVGTYPGAAWAYQRDTGGNWVLDSRLDPGPLMDFDFFGGTCVIRGDYALVGATGPGGYSSVFVFHRGGDGWALQNRILYTGYSNLAMDGTTAVIGTGGGAFVIDVANCTETDCNANGIIDSSDIVAGTSSDCNFNGMPDECDLATGASRDVNGDNIPDDCQAACVADLDQSGKVDLADLATQLANYGNPGAYPDGDLTGDGAITLEDLALLLRSYGKACQ